MNNVAVELDVSRYKQWNGLLEWLINELVNETITILYTDSMYLPNHVRAIAFAWEVGMHVYLFVCPPLITIQVK